LFKEKRPPKHNNSDSFLDLPLKTTTTNLKNQNQENLAGRKDLKDPSKRIKLPVWRTR